MQAVYSGFECHASAGSSSSAKSSRVGDISANASTFRIDRGIEPNPVVDGARRSDPAV
jgi:hypothetical protein